MNERDIKLRGEMHSLAGFLKGLREGIEYWDVDDVDAPALGRLRHALRQASDMADNIAIKMSSEEEK